MPADPGAPDEVAAAARGFADAVARIEAGELAFPLPGSGRTAERFAALRTVAEAGLSTARLVEGHVDAAAILAELGAPPPGPGERWGVWAAEPPGEGLTAVRQGAGWVLNGLKQYCSGAHSCTHALVTARAGESRRLFAVRVAAEGCRPVEGTWGAVGMAGSDTPDVRFTDVPATAVGEPEAYVDRPGFWHGGIGVAACWYGGAVAVARVLREAAEHRADPHTDAHLGAVDVQLHAAWTLLERAAREIDEDPRDDRGEGRLRAMRTRAFVESVCRQVLDHVGRATGAGPLCHDTGHARTVADLGVYIRQHHAERDLAGLGAYLARPEAGR
ncbi:MULTISPECIES: acyl-CoA dehydrogenase family protein [Streptomyces]|uniref:acyl-CoA dehydrogenase family protein n=1 Tax=Streptomyces TaxID=1883 RepID=UPI00099887C6|nr:MULTISPECIES: acyl-CoA dehydrogenase family protein [Streptomyces]MDP9952691.1 alkylation response protein AidB-like acyl-CoA dehydrogenase [Streptomyces sp. DSM 41269]